MANRSLFEQEQWCFTASQGRNFAGLNLQCLKLQAAIAYQTKLKTRTNQQQSTQANVLRLLNAIENTTLQDKAVPEPIIAFSELQPKQRQACISLAYLDSGLDEILKNRKSITIKQLKTSYRKLLKRYHPDHNQQPGSQKTFYKIQAAYCQLRNVIENSK